MCVPTFSPLPFCATLPFFTPLYLSSHLPVTAANLGFGQYISSSLAWQRGWGRKKGWLSKTRGRAPKKARGERGRSQRASAKKRGGKSDACHTSPPFNLASLIYSTAKRPNDARPTLYVCVRACVCGSLHAPALHVRAVILHLHSTIVLRGTKGERAVPSLSLALSLLYFQIVLLCAANKRDM